MENIFLEILSPIAQIVSLPVAAAAIVFAVIDARRSHDLVVVLNLSESFRDRWERKWRECVKRVEAFQRETHTHAIPKELLDEVRNILNWIDWVGSFLDAKLLKKETVLLETLGEPMAEVIEISREKLARDRESDRGRWAGVDAVARCLKLQPLGASNNLRVRLQTRQTRLFTRGVSVMR